MRKIVEIEDALWARFREGDGCASDEEALAKLLAATVTATTHSTELVLIAGKVKVLPCQP